MRLIDADALKRRAMQYYVCDFMDAQYEKNGFCHHAESEVEE